MTILTVRRLAADIMNVGQRRVKIAPDAIQEVEGALTRSDVKGLIEKGIITKAPLKGRASSRKAKRRGRGSRKGNYADRKQRWMQKVRSQRRFLKQLIEDGALEKSNKRSLYGKVKSGIFRSKRAMLAYLKEGKLVADDYEPKKAKPEKKAKPKKEKPKREKAPEKEKKEESE